MDAQENPSLEGNELEEKVFETEASSTNETEQPAVVLPQTQEEVIARLKELAQSDEIAEKQELDSLKQAFYKIHKNNINTARNKFIEDGGNPQDFLPAPNVLEDEFKQAMNAIKQKRAEAMAEQERIKEENLQKKLAILERIKTLSNTPEEANQAYKEFKDLQNQWKEITLIPASKINELWKTYQLYVEQYYDQLKLNNEFREYDFKKNLEIKTKICETAEKLAQEEDVVSAFQQLQALHQEYKETGPVAKELREEIWSRFKAASTTINKRHQQHFEDLKAQEEENLAKKTALCEKIEAISIDSIKKITEWDAYTKEIINLQTEWRSIGFAPQKMNVKIFERFRSACDKFFTAKAEFFKNLKEEQNKNLSLKTALCEKAEALKDSTDWKKTADTLVQLQKEWKTIGAVPKKYAESIWKRFIEACDYFFEQKNKANASQRNEENDNLEKKNNIIERLKALYENDIDKLNRKYGSRYSDFDAAVDELVTSDPYGFLISVAAGNEGDIPLHVEANLAPGTSRSTIVEMDDPSMTYVDIWSAPGEDFAAIVFLVDEDGNILEESAAHLSTQESYSQPLPISPEQTSTVRAYPEVNSYTGKTNLFLQINALQAVADGYTVGIQLQPLSETDSVHLHAWVSEGSFSNPAPENPEWMEGNTNYTINGSMGSSQSVITVASYTSRNDWDGTLFNQNEIGEISDFSSRGPLIGGAIKPDIAAPGEIVISSGNSFLSNYPGYLLADESLVNGKEYPWIISQGTSMSTPAVTGIMALLLQQNPYLSIEDMKTLLDETAVRDAFTGETKNARWGYGKIDALAALNVLESDSVYTISVTQNDGGKIIVTHESDTVTSETQFARGTVLRLKAVPETYHFLNSWWDGNTETEREYTVARDADISATFEQETMYTVTIEQTQGGRVLVTCENDTLDSETQLPEGVLVKLYAIADENYHFSEWWDGNTTANRSMALNRDLKIKAFFDEGSANEALASHNINIYPNPSDGVFRMECPGAKEAKVFNTQGQLIQTIRESLDNFSLDMQDQQPGLYYMHIRYPQSSQTVKLVIR